MLRAVHVFLISSLLSVAWAAASTAPEAYIISPKDGDVVSSPVTVVFGLSGYGVAPAGTMKEKTGHHHLIIDAPLPPADEEIPADKNHVHFGKGQTETRITLPSGTHTLQLLLADHAGRDVSTYRVQFIFIYILLFRLRHSFSFGCTAGSWWVHGDRLD